MKMLLGAILGGVVAWLYASGRGRQQARQRLAAAPDALQHVRQSVAAAAADGAQRVSQAIDAAPLPAQVKAPATVRRTTCGLPPIRSGSRGHRVARRRAPKPSQPRELPDWPMPRVSAFRGAGTVTAAG